MVKKMVERPLDHAFFTGEQRQRDDTMVNQTSPHTLFTHIPYYNRYRQAALECPGECPATAQVVQSR